MKTVYILTENGNEISEQGCRQIQTIISKKFNEKENLSFAMGAYLNNKKHFITVMEKCGCDAYAAASHDNEISIIGKDNIKDLVAELKSTNETNTWRVFMDMLNETKK